MVNLIKLIKSVYQLIDEIFQLYSHRQTDSSQYEQTADAFSLKR